MTQVYVGSSDDSLSVEPGSRHREARAKYRRAARSETTHAGAPRRVVNVRVGPVSTAGDLRLRLVLFTIGSGSATAFICSLRRR